MSEVGNNTNLTTNQYPVMKANDEPDTSAHYAKSMKVERPKTIISQGPSTLPHAYSFSDKEATKKMQQINTDIYEGAKKEKEKHEFNRKLYFKIFGGIAITAAGVAGFSKLRKWFGSKK